MAQGMTNTEHPTISATRPAPGRQPELISIVIPARNGGEMLRHQLSAIAEQDYSGQWEVVLADNASTDDTRAIAESFADRFKLSVVSADARGGASYVRNVAIRSASGDFIAHCDADDVVEPGWLTAMAAAAVDFHLVGGRLDEEFLNEGVAWRPRVPVDQLHRTDWLPYAVGANFGIWRETIDAAGGWNEEYRNVEDKELSYRVQVDGWIIGFAADAIVKYRHRAGLWKLFVQFHHYGRSDPVVYRDYRGDGHPRSRSVRALSRWLRLLVGAPLALFDRRKRALWVYTLGYSLGRIEGSVRYRTLFL